MRSLTSCRSLASLLLILTCGISYGQYNVLYQNLQSVNKYANKVAADLQGNVILHGSFSSSITFGAITLTASGSSNFIAKQNSSGAWLWAKKIAPANSSSVVRVHEVTTDNSGNIYLAGSFLGSVVFDNVSVSSASGTANYDFFIAKINSAGSIAWVKKEGTGTGDDEARGVAVDGSGNVYGTGLIVRKKDCKNCTVLNAKIISDVFVVKYNSSGTKQWEKKYANSNNNVWTNPFGGGGPDLRGNDIALDNSGNIYVTGQFFGKVNFGSTALTVTTTNPDLFLLKLNNNGATQWLKTGGSSAWDYGASLLVHNGNIYLTADYAGAMSINGTNLSHCAANWSSFVASYTATGSLNWVTSVCNLDRYDYMAALKSFAHPSGSLGVLANDHNGFRIIQYNASNGALVSSEVSTGGDAPDLAVSSAGFLLTANVYATETFSNLTLVPATNQSGAYILSYGASSPQLRTTKSDAEIENETKLSVYPNPVSNKLFIESKSEAGIGQYILLDQLGRVVVKGMSPDQKTELDMQQLPEGIYILKVAGSPEAIRVIKN